MWFPFVTSGARHLMLRRKEVQGMVITVPSIIQILQCREWTLIPQVDCNRDHHIVDFRVNT